MTEARCEFTSGTTQCIRPDCDNPRCWRRKRVQVLESVPDDAGGLAVELAGQVQACDSCGGIVERGRPTIEGLHVWCWAKLGTAAPTGTG